ncbi:MAG: hypothetical protein AB8G96_14920 [Phycisphaerales bacterium]
MSKDNLTWLGVIAVGIILLAVNALIINPGAGSTYVRATDHAFANVAPDGASPEWVELDSAASLDHDIANLSDDRIERWTTYSSATPNDYRAAEAAASASGTPQTSVRWSASRTFGTWLAALFTLAVLSFLIRDNPLYKIAEAIVIGVSAAYWMVVGFWGTIVPNLIGNLDPRLVTGWVLPDFERGDPMIPVNVGGGDVDILLLVPLVLGVMLLWRLAPSGGWISRWPMALIIGVFCGIRFVGFLQADFLSQIRATIVPLIVMGDGGFDLGDTLKHIVIVVGVLCCLVYFFFSIEHRGGVGKVARVGIWFLMITFGVGFGYTVMGRIALLAIRLEFLFDDWLWLIDPRGVRAEDAEAVAMLGSAAIQGLALASEWTVVLLGLIS